MPGSAWLGRFLGALGIWAVPTPLNSGEDELICRQRFRIPNNWDFSPSKKGGGYRFFDPGNPNNNIRVMPGNPNSPNPAQQQPYVKYQNEGQNYDQNGNPVPADSPASHIPASKLQPIGDAAMSNKVLWGRNILNAIRHVSDEGYQRRSWSGVGPEVSSPSEIYNVLFDDYGFSEFIEESPPYVSATTKSILSLLENRMNEIDDAALADSQPEAFIDHPAWREVRRVAIEAVRCLEKDLDQAGN